MHRKSCVTLLVVLLLLFIELIRDLFLKVQQKSFPYLNELMIDHVNYNNGNHLNLGFSQSSLLQAKTREIEVEQIYTLTAVLLH